MTLLMILIAVVLALSGAVMTGLTLLAKSSWGAAHQIRQAKDHSLSAAKFWKSAVINAAMSVVLVYGYTWAFGTRVYREEPVGLGRGLLEGVAILMLFDFFYYLLHRYPFHEWRTLRRVHAVHHIVRNPIAVDSLYQHPLEDFLGLTLLWACTLLVSLVAGPVSVYSFAGVFLVYSLLNVIVHAGLAFEGRALWLVTYLATRHNKHHVDMQGKNYASVTPLWDMVFGTEEP